MTLYIIITICLIDEFYEIRKQQYIRGINSVIDVCKNNANYKIILVENNGARDTFLNTFDLPILYTRNNKINTGNKGIKELQDVLDCIKYFNIDDNDFIVKITGRYYLDNDSPFFNVVNNLQTNNYECVIRYGSYINPVSFKCADCITGLIGLLCKYVKKIEMPNNNECVEWKWAKTSLTVDNDKVCLLDKLGIYIAPASNNYFIV